MNHIRHDLPCLDIYKRTYRALLEHMSAAVARMPDSQRDFYEHISSEYASDEVRHINHQCGELIRTMVKETTA